MIPKEVSDWVNNHCGARIPSYCQGEFDNFKNSKSSACWGGNTLETENYFISVCQPSPRTTRDITWFLFDFKVKDEIVN